MNAVPARVWTSECRICIGTVFDLSTAVIETLAKTDPPCKVAHRLQYLAPINCTLVHSKRTNRPNLPDRCCCAPELCCNRSRMPSRTAHRETGRSATAHTDQGASCRSQHLQQGFDPGR